MWLVIGIFFLRFCVGSTLLLAGFFKIRAGKNWFRKSIQDYVLVRGLFLDILTYAIPPLEIICGFLIVTGIALPFATLFSFALLVTFTGAILVALIQRRNITCGCFGRRLSPAYLHRNFLYRNLTLLLFVTIIYAHSIDETLQVLNFGANLYFIQEVALSITILTTILLGIIVLIIEFISRTRRLA